MRLASRVKKLKPSVLAEIYSEVALLKNNPKIRVIDFTAGQPDFSVPEEIRQAGCQAISSGQDRYTQTLGIEELRKSLAQSLAGFDSKLAYNPYNQIIVSPGGKFVIYLAAGSVIEKGDGVLMFLPAWSTFPALVDFWGGISYYFDLGDNQTQIENLEKVIAESYQQQSQDKIKGLIVNSPCNPSGKVMTRAELELLAKLANKYDLWVISDEVYKELVYPPAQHLSIASLPGMLERTLVVGSMSKPYSMTGWRLGYGAGPEDWIEAMRKIQSESVTCASEISQRAALKALNSQQAEQSISKMRDSFFRRLNENVLPFAQRLQQKYGVKFFLPQGAFYLMIELPQAMNKNCKDFCLALLRQTNVGIFPGIAFGYPGWIRISYAVSDQDLRDGLALIEKFIEQ